MKFLTRRGCHICDDALALFDGIPLEIIDIDLDLELLAEYDHRVPVVVDSETGEVLLEGSITSQQVRGLLG
jgi:hypothetical protein